MKFEDGLLLKNVEGVEFDNIEDLIDYFASIFCDNYGDCDNEDLIYDFFEENELGEVPTMAKDWVKVLNDIDEGWYIID